MNLNSDLSARAAIHAARLDWTPSPVPGVDRRMLDRIGDEVARATSIVRYAPRSHSRRTHMVAARSSWCSTASFRTSMATIPQAPMSATRPPVTTRQVPEPGCTLFVKLWQFDPDDRAQLRTDTRALLFLPVPGLPGIERASLFENAGERVRLERWAPWAVIDMPVEGGIELLVMAGGFHEAGEEFTYQSWLRLPAGSRLQATAGQGGCKVWVKSDHLARNLRFPKEPATS
jgi:ChrR Cupin-like domain